MQFFLKKDIKIKLSEDCGLYKSMDKKITRERKVFEKKNRTPVL